MSDYEGADRISSQKLSDVINILKKFCLQSLMLPYLMNIKCNMKQIHVI